LKITFFVALPIILPEPSKSFFKERKSIMEKMFEKATRLKLRFESPKGLLCLEDLYDVDLRTLNQITVKLHNLTGNKVISFIDNDTKKEDDNFLRFELAKHIIEVRLAEKTAMLMANENREKRQRLMAILADKENESLRNMSPDDLKKMIDDL